MRWWAYIFCFNFKISNCQLGQLQGTLCEKEEHVALVEELSSSLPLNKAALCSERSGDKERQQPSKHM